ncbi:hypothetical protein L2E82_06876 [Cichorium intybus]|uniref:Uncharacterized protein n=1 Tax=Cichorium intybus TaxID=13427 RepID=A0ACB9G4G8_CICIN|nr:hypothetical protein L2E82_06876 [Cichorium intybus]
MLLNIPHETGKTAGRDGVLFTCHKTRAVPTSEGFLPPTPTRAKPTYAISPFFKTLSSINASSSSLSFSFHQKLSLNLFAVFRSDALSSQVPFDLIPNLFSVS